VWVCDSRMLLTSASAADVCVVTVTPDDLGGEQNEVEGYLFVVALPLVLMSSVSAAALRFGRIGVSTKHGAARNPYLVRRSLW
jgi:hypothetical protein